MTNSTTEKNKITYAPSSIDQRIGELRITMLNDYAFKAVFQTALPSLKALVASLLHLQQESITDIHVENPIELGGHYDTKTFVLDIKATVNNSFIINLEMQVFPQKFWMERSLGYLCRSFDSLNCGDNYWDTKPALHFGFLNFDLKHTGPKFFSTYVMMEKDTHHVYSDKFQLSVIELKHIDMATEEDKAYGIDTWAKFFRAKSWKEINMLAAQNPNIKEAAEYLATYTEEDTAIREAILARELAMNGERAMQRDLDRLEIAVAEKEAILAKQEAALAKQEATLAKQETTLAKQKATLAKQEATLAKQEATLAKQGASLAEKDASLAEKDELIQKLQAELQALKTK